MATLQELMDQRAKIDAEIDRLRSGQRATAMEEIRSLMEQHGLRTSDLSGRTPSATKKAATKASVKVAAKYREPASGNSWSGRGLQPRWLKAALADGKKIEDFAV